MICGQNKTNMCRSWITLTIAQDQRHTEELFVSAGVVRKGHRERCEHGLSIGECAAGPEAVPLSANGSRRRGCGSSSAYRPGRRKPPAPLPARPIDCHIDTRNPPLLVSFNMKPIHKEMNHSGSVFHGASAHNLANVTLRNALRTISIPRPLGVFPLLVSIHLAAPQLFADTRGNYCCIMEVQTNMEFLCENITCI